MLAVSSTGNSSPVPLPLKVSNAFKVTNPITETYTFKGSILGFKSADFMPVPQVTVQTNVLGAPGSTGSSMCYGTYVTVTQTNECGQTETIQQYWVQSSITCYPVVN